ncbi:MAG: sigma-70 family RNA polymerase sigma factor [Planctomycetia bacterium]|nr:sigma-70 family RNA polymerase sigma factor [Planctomycetia bacterium]
MRGFIGALVADFSVVDDVVQETFMTVTAKAGDFEPGSNFRAWAWAIAKIKILEVSRANSRQSILAADVVEALCARDEAVDWNALDALLIHVRACVETLAPKARLAFELRYKNAHRPPEIARRMNWTANAVHVALSRARVAVRECVERRLGAEGGCGAA